MASYVSSAHRHTLGKDDVKKKKKKKEEWKEGRLAKQHANVG
jgi:hypothetical protein